MWNNRCAPDIKMSPLTLSFIQLFLCFLFIGVCRSQQTGLVCTVFSCFEVPVFKEPLTSCQCTLYGFNVPLCADFLFHDATNITENVNSYFTTIMNSSALEKSLFRENLQVVILNSGCQIVKTPEETINITIIKHCPREVNNPIKDLCENSTQALPPIDLKGHMHIAFHNVYCAMCHGASEEYVRQNMLPWELVYNCPNDNSPATPELVSCEKRYKPPPPADVCDSDVHDDFLAIVKYNECTDCMQQRYEDPDATSMECTVCSYAIEALTRQCVQFNPGDGGTSLSSLFSLPTQAEVEVAINGGMFTSSQLCKDDENFDLIFQKCRSFICPQGQFAKHGNCLQDDKTFMMAKSQPFPNGSDKFCVEIVFHQGEDEEKEFNWDYYADNNIIGFRDIVDGIMSIVSGTTTVIKINNETALLDVESVWDISYTLDKLKNLKLSGSWNEHDDLDIYVNNFMNDTHWNISCFNGNFECFSNSVAYYLNTDVFAKIVYQNRSLLFPLDNILYNFEISRKEDRLTFSEICVCSPKNDGVENPLNCSFPLYKYDIEEYVVLKNGNLQLRDTNLQFDEFKFYIDNGTAIVCYDPNHENGFFRFDDTQMYLSIACTGLSILFLVITVIMYLVSAELRNLPGKLTLGLSIFLIIGQSLLLVQDLEKSVCKYVAALTHFCWFSVFLWMSCIACNMLLAFHPRMALTSAGWRGNRAFRIYCTICLIIPGLVCATLLILDITQGDHFHIQYGVVSCSWMSNKYGYIFSFFVPVAVTLLGNLICFCFTLFYIEKTMKSSEEVTGRKREKSRCKIYIRLSSVMGFAWIFGFIASVAEVPVLWYIYIILNGLQGVFIFISFSVNTRTHRLLRIKMSGFSSIFRSQSESQSTPVNTTRIPDTP